MSVARYHLPVRPTRSILSWEAYWILALGFFVIGDLTTTVIGLRTGGFVEVGPLTQPVMGLFGLWGLVGVKTVSLGLIYWAWLGARGPSRAVIPLIVAVVGGLATGWNIALLLVAG